MVATREWAMVDSVAAVALATAAQVEIWSPGMVPGVGRVVGDRPVLAATAVAATLPLALRRRYPLATLLVVVGGLALQQVLTSPTDGLVLLLAAMIAAYSSTAFSSVPYAAAAGVVLVGGAALIGEDASDSVFVAVVLGGAWLAGFVVMQRSTDLSRTRQENEALSVRLVLAADQLVKAQRQTAPSPAPGQLAALTARELEVVRKIATGMTNAEIVASLVISEWTVKTHVASALRKLSLRDRAQVVVAAYESGVVVPRTPASAQAREHPRSARP